MAISSHRTHFSFCIDHFAFCNLHCAIGAVPIPPFRSANYRLADLLIHVQERSQAFSRPLPVVDDRFAICHASDRGIRIESRDLGSLKMTNYTRLVLAAGTCGLVMGIAMIADAWESMYFIPASIFSLLVPIGSGIALSTLGMAARAGSSRAFQASWILAAILAIPVGIAVGTLVLFRSPTSMIQDLPQMGLAEKIGLASLTASLPILAAIVAVGSRGRGRMTN